MVRYLFYTIGDLTYQSPLVFVHYSVHVISELTDRQTDRHTHTHKHKHKHKHIHIHTHTFKLTESPTCPCNEGAQTPEHLIYACKILEVQRSSLKQNITAVGGS